MTSAASDSTIGTRAFCDNCPYWTGGQGLGGRGLCRRNPPTSGVGFEKSFPTTTPLDWCGEHPLRRPRADGSAPPVSGVPGPKAVAMPRKRKAA